MSETNLRVLRPSRKKPAPGDVFVAQLPAGEYLFGRVISRDAVIGPMTGCVLLYLFRARSDTRQPPDTALRTDELLLPPVMTNTLPWSRGYFETVDAGRPFEPGELLDRHCFEDPGRPGWYFDEHGARLPGPVPPVGVWALQSYRTIDDRVSDAVGIGRVPG